MTATRDYVEKNRFRSVVLGLSGGIDSALVATIARDALGADRVHVVGMPSEWSSDHSVTDAEDLADRQGLHWSVVADQADGRRLDRLGRADRAGAGEPAGARARHHAHGAVQRARPPGADDRQQERGRDRLLHAVRRQRRRFRADQGRAEAARLRAGPLAQPGRRGARRGAADPGEHASPSRRRPSSRRASSTATGCRRTRCSTRCWTPTSSRTRAGPSWSPPASTRPVVDRVIALVDAAEYKRRQSPPGPKITGRAFGRDRRLPITSRWRETAAPPRRRARAGPPRARLAPPCGALRTVWRRSGTAWRAPHRPLDDDGAGALRGLGARLGVGVLVRGRQPARGPQRDLLDQHGEHEGRHQQRARRRRRPSTSSRRTPRARPGVRPRAASR